MREERRKNNGDERQVKKKKEDVIINRFYSFSLVMKRAGEEKPPQGPPPSDIVQTKEALRALCLAISRAGSETRPTIWEVLGRTNTLEALTLELELELTLQTLGYANRQLESYVYSHDERRATNESMGITPSWSPLSLPSFSGAITLNINLITTTQRSYRGWGLGRAAFNALERAMADNMEDDGSYGRLKATVVFMPTFLTVDSHFGWHVFVPPKLLREPPPAVERAVANPSLLFPLHLNPRPDEVKENATATLSYVDLCWAAPWVWHQARCEEAERRGLIFLDVCRWLIDEWLTTVLVHQHQTTTTHGDNPLASVVYGDDDEDNEVAPVDYTTMPGREDLAFTVVMPPSHSEGARLPMHLRNPIVKACRRLGNIDVSQGADSIAVMVMRMHGPPMIFSPQLVWVVRLMITYLVDYGRTVYRPLVIDEAIVASLKLTLDAQTFGEALYKNVGENEDLLPRRPRPYWAGSPSLALWVPVAKPRSYDSDTREVLTIPMDEPRLVFLLSSTTTSNPPPGKKPRLDEFSCHACHSPKAEWSDGVHVFCGTECQSNYDAWNDFL
jgi:hypothetical protein